MEPEKLKEQTGFYIRTRTDNGNEAIYKNGCKLTFKNGACVYMGRGMTDDELKEFFKIAGEFGDKLEKAGLI
jgi:hypothetical protein